MNDMNPESFLSNFRGFVMRIKQLFNTR